MSKYWAMAVAPSTKPFAEALRDALQGLGRSQNQLAADLGLDPSFFSRAVRGVGGKRLRLDQMREIARILDLPQEYFAELREDWLVRTMRDDPELGLWLYRAARNRTRSD